jgi:hypothetical protein
MRRVRVTKERLHSEAIKRGRTLGTTKEGKGSLKSWKPRKMTE